MGASTIPGTWPQGFISPPCLKASSNSRPTGGPSRTTKTITTTTATAGNQSHVLRKIPQLGDFSSLNLDASYSAIHETPYHFATSKASETVVRKTPDPPSQTTATRTTAAATGQLPYNILKVPKLGNFSSLELSSTGQPSNQPQNDPAISASEAQGAAMSGTSSRLSLGDFSKVFEPLGYLSPSSTTSSATADLAQTAVVYAIPQICPQTELCRHGDNWATGCVDNFFTSCKGARGPENLSYSWIRHNSSPHDIESAWKSPRLSPALMDSDGRSLKSSPGPSGYETGLTTPPQSPALADNSNHKMKGLAPASPGPKILKTDNDAAFEYSLDDSPSRSVVKKSEVQRKLENFRKRHLKDKYERTCRQSEDEYHRDGDATRLYPEIAEGDVHIFADVSNIFISLLHTVKKALNIPSTAKIYPNLDLDWRKLVEIASRGRPIATLKAGCSVNPERSRNPAFIQRLEDAGFDVGVRDRVQNQEGRWVEKLVDESIQVDIGDCVEQHKGNKGTIIIVTGDGKPAEQSSGFIRYARHALGEGWHVEVICWDVGCSQAWRGESWEKVYGGRYRLISLDSYLGELWDKEF